MNEWDDCLAGHIAAKDQYIGFVKFSCIEKLVPTNVRPMDVGCEEEFCHVRGPRGGMEYIDFIIPFNIGSLLHDLDQQPVGSRGKQSARGNGDQPGNHD